MTNFEFWKDEILRIYRECGSIPTIVKGRPIPCSDVKCDNCDIALECVINMIEWFYKEHIERPKLTKRERVFCEAVKTGWIARDFKGELFFFTEYLNEGLCTHVGNYCRIYGLEDDFDFIKWEDKEPCSVEDLLKLEVKEDEEDDLERKIDRRY